MTMAVTLVREDSEWSLVLSGVVDIRAVAVLHGCAREAVAGPNRGVVARLQDCEAIDTATTQILLALKSALGANGRALRLEGTPGPIAAAWRLAGLGDHLR